MNEDEEQDSVEFLNIEVGGDAEDLEVGGNRVFGAVPEYNLEIGGDASRVKFEDNLSVQDKEVALKYITEILLAAESNADLKEKEIQTRLNWLESKIPVLHGLLCSIESVQNILPS